MSLEAHGGMLEGGPGLTGSRVTVGVPLPGCADEQSGTHLLGVPSEEQPVANASPGHSLNKQHRGSPRDCQRRGPFATFLTQPRGMA